MYNGVVLDIGSPNNVNNDLDSFWKPHCVVTGVIVNVGLTLRAWANDSG